MHASFSTVWLDGDTACDGCGAVVVDGVEAGEACFSEFTPTDTGEEPTEDEASVPAKDTAPTAASASDSHRRRG